MNRKTDRIESRLDRMSRTEAPDGWSALRDRALRTPQVGADAPMARNERRPLAMKKKSLWIASLSTAAAVVLVAAVMFAFVLPGLSPAALTVGQSLKTAHGTLFVNAVTPNGGKIGMPADAEAVELSFADLAGLFGRDPIPTLPKGFVADSPTVSATLFSNGTVFLMNGITFSTDATDAKAPRVVFDLNDQGELPLADCLFGNGTPSTIDGVEMTVGLETWQGEDAPFDVYTASFVAGGVGYRIRAMNVTTAQFLEILEAAARG
jgi:hypothetical protein